MRTWHFATEKPVTTAMRSTAFHPLGAILVITEFGIQVAFLASVGIWLSTIMRTPAQTNVAIGLILLVFFGACPWMLSIGLADRGSRIEHLMETGLNPIGDWLALTSLWADWKTDATLRPKIVASLWGSGIYAVLGLACWSAALRRLRHAKGSRGPTPL